MNDGSGAADHGFLLELIGASLRVPVGTRPEIRTRLTNTSAARWHAAGSRWVFGHLFDFESGAPLPENERMALTLAARIFDLGAGEHTEIPVLLWTLDPDRLAAGRYLLRVRHPELELQTEGTLLVDARDQ